MEKDINDSDFQNSSISRDYENEQSLVGKFKKNVSEIINNTPLSKWFKKSDIPSSYLRKRQDDSDDETDIQEFQPPTKRTKLPPTKEALSINVSQVLSPISKVNDIKKPYNYFPEPIAGPSGYQTRKMLNSTSFTIENSFKTTKDNERPNIKINEMFKNSKNSEESTSGYSSGRIGSKEIVSQDSSKQTSPLENSPVKARSLFQNSSTGRSLFPDQTLCSQKNTTLSSRMPSFNASNSRSSFVDRTLSTKKILNSPFYSGRTIYGGASAYGRASGRTPHDLKKVLRHSVNIKPVNSNLEKVVGVPLGKTARRILDTLEQYSSPVSDAKKIPITSKKMHSEGSLTKYIGANPYTVRGPRSASNKELQVPAVTDLLKMKMDQQKTRLQDSTEAVRHIAATSKSVLNETSYQLAVHNDKEKRTGKIKTKITAVRQKAHVEEAAPIVKLNPVALPIKEIPKFDFVVPPPTIASEVKNAEKLPVSSLFTTPSTVIATHNEAFKLTSNKPKKPDDSKNNQSTTSPIMDFKFSAPLVLAECMKPIKALNNFKFSEPLVKKRRSIHSQPENKENDVSDLLKTRKNNGDVSKLTNDVITQKTNTNNGTLMDKFKPKEGTWECSVCMIRNQADKTKCAACETPRSSPNKTVVADPKPSLIPSTQPTTSSTFSFGSTFRTPSDQWICDTCMIRNKVDVTKCAACETPKPGSAGVKANIASSSTSTSSFGAIVAPSGTWECSTCMIRNKEEVVNCAACETAKPGTKGQAVTTTVSFGAEFKKKDNEWECEVCMIRNKADASKCQCCESLKPGSSLTKVAQESGSKGPTFSFGIDKATAGSFTFGIPPTAQAEQSAPKTNASLVFGESKVDGSTTSKEPPKFSFGLSAKTAIEKPKDEKPAATATAAPKADTLTASVKDNDKKSTSSFEVAKTTPASSFVFGSAVKNDADSKDEKKEEMKRVNPLLKPGEKLPEKAASLATAGFSFGLSKTSTQVTTNTAQKPSETPAANEEAPSKKVKQVETVEPVKPPAFTFGAPANGDANKSLVFKADLASKSTSSPAGFAFSFKSPEVSVNSSGVANANVVTFGSSTATTKASKTPSFSFTSGSSGAPKSTNGFSFTPATSALEVKSAAGASASNSDTKTFVFGSASRQPAINSSAPLAATPTVPTFGATPVSKPPMFQFSAAASDNKTQTSAPPSFSFNADNKPATPQFSLGSSAVAPAPSFGFGHTSTPAFGFGSSAAPTTNHFGSAAKPETNNVFGAATASSTASNGIFNFGSTSSRPQKAVFSFGSSTETNGPSGNAPLQSGFSFGSEQNKSSSSGGFNFSGTSAPSFDANAKPMFNFTGNNVNTPTFSAPPAQEGTMPKRVIKKAIRRSAR
ncbi:hypothetical protein GWI33_016275 [Rhynchophorus ferrugineus]|uniref:Nuclear pore complex protein Nup153 n=1 Tax=Rhynchophorus ferrugineus TaxID=354439 RepID=A0A834I0F6_RHYFE|nr:hypothetical protein GWI33_016275 [Rhynchophorus ferrugineus]